MVAHERVRTAGSGPFDGHKPQGGTKEGYAIACCRNGRRCHLEPLVTSFFDPALADGDQLASRRTDCQLFGDPGKFLLSERFMRQKLLCRGL